MFIEKIRSPGLAHLSYFIGSGTEAAVIDPRRDCEVYLDLADKNGMSIDYVLETHRNEDYVTGSMELNVASDARIMHGSLPFSYGEHLTDQEEDPDWRCSPPCDRYTRSHSRKHVLRSCRPFVRKGTGGGVHRGHSLRRRGGTDRPLWP